MSNGTARSLVQIKQDKSPFMEVGEPRLIIPSRLVSIIDSKFRKYPASAAFQLPARMSHLASLWQVAEPNALCRKPLAIRDKEEEVGAQVDKHSAACFAKQRVKHISNQIRLI